MLPDRLHVGRASNDRGNFRMIELCDCVWDRAPTDRGVIAAAAGRRDVFEIPVYHDLELTITQLGTASSQPGRAQLLPDAQLLRRLQRLVLRAFPLLDLLPRQSQTPAARSHPNGSVIQEC